MRSFFDPFSFSNDTVGAVPFGYPTTVSPTVPPTTVPPTTVPPTTVPPTTVPPTTVPPTTVPPTTVPPTTVPPTTVPPTTVPPTTVPPTTVPPTTVPPTTVEPPTTVPPTTVEPPTTFPPVSTTTVYPTTVPPALKDCPWWNCTKDPRDPVADCVRGEVFDCDECECVPDGLDPCPKFNCTGNPAHPVVDCLDGFIFDCDKCICVPDPDNPPVDPPLEPEPCPCKLCGGPYGCPDCSFYDESTGTVVIAPFVCAPNDAEYCSCADMCWDKTQKKYVRCCELNCSDSDCCDRDRKQREKEPKKPGINDWLPRKPLPGTNNKGGPVDTETRNTPDIGKASYYELPTVLGILYTKLNRAQREYREVENHNDYWINPSTGKYEKIVYLKELYLPVRIENLKKEIAYIEEKLGLFLGQPIPSDQQPTTDQIDGGIAIPKDTGCRAYQCSGNINDPSVSCTPERPFFNCTTCNCEASEAVQEPCNVFNCSGDSNHPIVDCWKIKIATGDPNQLKYYVGGYNCDTCECDETEPPFAQSVLDTGNDWRSVKFVMNDKLTQALKSGITEQTS